jgi:hypothetical protein
MAIERLPIGVHDILVKDAISNEQDKRGDNTANDQTSPIDSGHALSPSNAAMLHRVQ